MNGIREAIVLSGKKPKGFNALTAVVLQEILSASDTAWSIRQHAEDFGLGRCELTKIVNDLSLAGIIECFINRNRRDGRHMPTEINVTIHVRRAYENGDEYLAAFTGRMCGERWAKAQERQEGCQRKVLVARQHGPGSGSTTTYPSTS
jgi:hypothetical protein